MTNNEVIRKFKEGATKGLATHLYIKGDELINYSTVIAYRDKDGQIHLNIRKYGSTTSKIQSECKRVFGNLIVEEYEGAACTLWNWGYQGAKRIKASDVYN